MNSFVTDVKSIIENGSKQTTFFDAEVLTAYWETTSEIIARVLPPPLKPARQPLVSAFVTNYPKTNFSEPYREAALFVYAEFDGHTGNYCIAISVDDDMAMAMGREFHGFPKKLARIELTKDGAVVSGSLSRHGIEFFSMTATLNGKTNVADGKKTIEDIYGSAPPIFNYKYSHSTDGSGYDLSPRLVEQQEEFEENLSAYGEAEVKLQDSPHDPWSELKVVRLLGATYTTSGTIVLARGKVLGDVDSSTYSHTRGTSGTGRRTSRSCLRVYYEECDMKGFSGKSAVITGGSSGFGLAIARECAKRRIGIVLADIDGERLQTAAQQLAADGADVLPVQMDVMSYTDMQMLGKKALEKHGSIDLLFNNAGVIVPGPAWMLSMNDWEWIMKTNVWGAIHGQKVFIPMMLERGNDCHIVNTASIAGLISLYGMSAYHTSKFAIVGLSESTYLDIQSITQKIKMSIFCPGFIKTDLDNSEQHSTRTIEERRGPTRR